METRKTWTKVRWDVIWAFVCGASVILIIILGYTIPPPPSTAGYGDLNCMNEFSYSVNALAWQGCVDRVTQYTNEYSAWEQLFEAPVTTFQTITGIVAVIFAILFVITWVRRRRLAQNADSDVAVEKAIDSYLTPSGFSPQSASAASTSSLPQTSLEAELQKLADMKQRGVIDEDEYKRLRANLINRG